jgi:hypothetical protein
MEDTRSLTPAFRPVVYDAARRRLWLFGQRCHHGATGALLAGVAIGGLLTARFAPRSAVGLVASGSLLMAHDWKDRSIWFVPGHQHQP